MRDTKSNRSSTGLSSSYKSFSDQSFSDLSSSDLSSSDQSSAYLQPTPWDRPFEDGLGLFKHDCWEQHAQWPADNTPPLLHGYDSEVLKDRAAAIREQSLNNPSLAQQALKYEIINEYLLVDLENTPVEQYYPIFESWAIFFDKYFFDGSLTQGPTKLLSIRLSWTHYEPDFYAFAPYSIAAPARRVVLLMKNAHSGVLYSKWDLFESLLHEMCHVYTFLFYNFCPVKMEFETEYSADGGHGILWATVFHNACAVVATWLPELSYFGRHPKTWLQEPEVEDKEIEPSHLYFLDEFLLADYITIASRSTVLQAKWEVSTVDGNSVLFKRAVIDLNYSYEVKVT
ncbi:hypothetical protein ONZ43_g6061 [Nemania bipapillata]|uniref:Uncharacterized protein n=1 Tax=Nemania bipapillata TaxID=110536 RepID=A0ACC2I3F6_9PEZI|nr:hypothetical protein ONZ43_g6061 [Nemania bipapillata]